MRTLGLSAQGLALAFPFHFSCRQDLRIEHVAAGLAALCPNLCVGTSLAEAFALERPRVRFSFDSLVKHAELVFMLRSRSNPSLVLRGQIVHEREYNTLVFLGAPWVTTFAELSQLGLGISDFPVHDSLGDLLFLLTTKELALEDAQILARNLKLTNDKLAQSQWRFRALVQGSTDITAVVDAKGIFTYVNPAVQTILGKAPEQLVGKSLPEQVHAEDRDLLNDALRRLMVRPATPERLELRFQAHGDNWVTLDISLNDAFEVSEVTGVVMNARDVTAQNELRDQLVRAQRLDSLGQLAGGIAHEFNNLLTVILNNALLIQDTTPSVQLESTEIVTASERAANLTRQFLGYGRKQRYAPTVVDLQAHLPSLHNMLDSLVAHEISIVGQFFEKVGLVRVDLAQLEQMIVNLVLNARDAMSEGGVIRIELFSRTLLKPQLDQVGTCLAANRYAVLRISDEGVGMSPDVLDLIFDPFFTTKEVGKGTGLGLSTTSGLVIQNRGGIFVESTPSVGSRFEVWLPVTSELPDTVLVKKEVAPRSREQKELLVLVEDEPSVRRMLTLMITRLGYRVFATGDPFEAQRRCTSTQLPRVSLLVTDIVMPTMRGPALLDAIRQERPELPAIFITGYAPEDSAPEIDPRDILQKPFSSNLLARRIRSLLDRDAL